MQQRAGEQQAAVHGIGILRGKKIGKAQHVERVHQKTGQKAVMYALGGGNGAERRFVAAEHLLAHGAVVEIFDRGDERLDLVIACLAVDGRDAHKARNIDRVALFGKAQSVDCELWHAAVIRHAAAYLEYLSGVAFADGAAVIPDFCFDRAARVGEHCAQKRLAACRHLGKGGFEQIKTLHVHAALHLCNGKTGFHDINLISARPGGRFFHNRKHYSTMRRGAHEKIMLLFLLPGAFEPVLPLGEARDEKRDNIVARGIDHCGRRVDEVADRDGDGVGNGHLGGEEE